MKLDATDTINFPVKEAFLAYRDDMDKLATYMLNISRIDVLERKVEPSTGEVHIHNVWYAQSAIPALLKPIITPNLLHWDDYAVWSEEKQCCSWRIEPAFLRKNLDISGTTVFTAQSATTSQITVTLNITISMDNIPGIPGFLKSKVIDSAEKFLSTLLLPNMRETNKHLNTYLATKART